jgi:hypothetical protein
MDRDGSAGSSRCQINYRSETRRSCATGKRQAKIKGATTVKVVAPVLNRAGKLFASWSNPANCRTRLQASILFVAVGRNYAEVGSAKDHKFLR